MPPFRPLTRYLHPHPSQSLSCTATNPSKSLKTSILHTRTLASHSEHSSEAGSSHVAHGAHESHYDPPSGWLWGIPPGERYKKEGWENTWVYGYWGSLLLGVVFYVYKPDTSIQTWALEEARRRLEKEGILEDPFPENGEKPKPRRYYEAREG